MRHKLCQQLEAVYGPLPKPPAGDHTDVCVLAIIKKSGERYVFLFNDVEEQRVALCRTLGRFAADASLSFTWTDAAVLSQKIRNLK